MTGAKFRSPIPYFLLTVFLGLVPILKYKYPVQFFPALSPWLVEVTSVVLGVAAAFWVFQGVGIF